jgi:uncharacterized membrane protein YtjA (UPF0391 family)
MPDALTAQRHEIEGTRQMIGWAIIMFIIALVAGAFGFGVVASASVGIAKVVFGIFMILCLVSLVFSTFSGRSPRV